MNLALDEKIEELGYTIEDIISNGARTQQFMNQIFDLAEQEFDTKFDIGIKSVRADIMPDHTISLTFSEHPGTEGVMDHIKDIVNGLLNTIPKQKSPPAWVGFYFGWGAGILNLVLR